jgi:protein-S-isoprenylcysteine O-methyltransferase Ste14
MYLAIILWSQHWLIVLIGTAGAVSLYLISIQEDQRLIEKFGDDYKRYIQNVPRMNLLVGIIRLVQHWKRE